MNIPACVTIVLASFFVTSCSRDLTRSEADRIVAEHPKATGITPVTTEGISKTSDSEAITKTRIGGQVFNLKFRRYDKQWRWEFVETKGGGWLASDELLDQLQEKERLKRVDAWAATQMEAYIKTIASMDRYSDYMPRRTDWPFDVGGWLKTRKMILDLRRSFTPKGQDPAKYEEETKQLEGPAFDAWGNEILLHFNSTERKATFVSLGPDKQKGTDDEVICLVSGQHGWDDFNDRIAWDYTKAWQLPEGLQPALDKSIEELENRRATFTRPVK